MSELLSLFGFGSKPQVPESAPYYIDAKDQGKRWDLAKPIVRRLSHLQLDDNQRVRAMEYAGTIDTDGSTFFRGITLLEALQFITQGQQTSDTKATKLSTFVTTEYQKAHDWAFHKYKDENYPRILGKTEDELRRMYGQKLLEVLDTPVMLQIKGTRSAEREFKRNEFESRWEAYPPITIADLTEDCVGMFQDIFNIPLTRYNPVDRTPEGK